MRWMKRVAAGVLAAGMALTLLTACSRKIGDPVQTSAAVVKQAAESITGQNVTGSAQYIQYRIVGTSDVGELKYTAASNGQTYTGTEDRGELYSRWSSSVYYEVDNKASKIVKYTNISKRSPDTVCNFSWAFHVYNSQLASTFNCYNVRYRGEKYIAEEELCGNCKFIYYYESAESTTPAYLYLEHTEFNVAVMLKIESWALGSDVNSVVPEQYRTPMAVWDVERYSNYEGYSEATAS